VRIRAPLWLDRLALLAGICVVVCTASAGAGMPKLHGNNFYVNCRFSHASNDDPIVYPGFPGLSHAHTFFGNTSTDARSTPASLRRGGTTCKPAADRGAYWVPTLYEQGRPVKAAKAQFYYNLRGYQTMSPFPAGLKMITGDAHAKAPQSENVVYWSCGTAGVRTRVGNRAPECGVLEARFHGVAQRCATCERMSNFPVRAKTFVELHLNFPDCWDGKHLDSPDHRSHMAYSRNYVCPASHPVKVPLIRLTIRYPITDGRDVVLASGGQLTAHADFINAWDQHVLARLVDVCFHDRPCDTRLIH
jgi:hypothetical protein